MARWTSVAQATIGSIQKKMMIKMATVERTLTIDVRKDMKMVPKYRRAKKVVNLVRAFLMQHMKATEENVKMGKYLNLKIWEHGIKNPITKITVIAKKDDKGIVTAELPNIPVKKQKPVKAKGAEKTAKKEGKTAPAATASAPTPAKTAAVAKEGATEKKA